jgi:hypothetical protein
MEALTVRRVQYSEDLLKRGDYFFVEKRQPAITFKRVPLDPPQGILERIWWRWFGKKEELKQIIEIVWPEYDAIIVNCPQCNQPCATSKEHRIVSVEPLTIETPVTCPYCRTLTFKVTEGKLITA